MKKEIQQKNARQTIHLSSRKHKEMGHSTRVGGQSEPYLHEILDGPLSHLTLSTTSKAALMRFNGVLLYELGLWGHAGVAMTFHWCFISNYLHAEWREEWQTWAKWCISYVVKPTSNLRLRLSWVYFLTHKGREKTAVVLVCKNRCMYFKGFLKNAPTLINHKCLFSLFFHVLSDAHRYFS